MEKVKLRKWNVVREIIKTNTSNMPDRINILALDLFVKNSRLGMTSHVTSPTKNNELFYLENSVLDKAQVRTYQWANDYKLVPIEAVVERFSEAFIHVKIPAKFAESIKNGLYKWKGEFFIQDQNNLSKFKHILTGKIKEDFPVNEAIWYGVPNGHCCAVASSSHAKKFEILLYATHGVKNFDNAEWSRSVHHGMYEELLKELLAD